LRGFSAKPQVAPLAADLLNSRTLGADMPALVPVSDALMEARDRSGATLDTAGFAASASRAARRRNRRRIGVGFQPVRLPFVGR
jgi:hypothetical protein